MLTVAEIYERKKTGRVRFRTVVLRVTLSFKSPVQNRLYGRLYKLYSIHTNNIDDNKGRYSQGCTQGGVL